MGGQSAPMVGERVRTNFADGMLMPFYSCSFSSLSRALFSTLLVVSFQALAVGESSDVQVRVGSVNPKVACSSNPAQTYALYLPSGFSTNRQWPILYLFDPFARGQVAAEVVQPGAEKFGYILAASNNSKNGPMGGSREAAIAMWEDTQLRLPVDTRRRYVAGLSGGARVAASVALSCGDCVAGVIADAAGFPVGAAPPRHMSFAYFAAVGNADFNYTEFISLRRELDKANARYRIRVFEGSHGWASAQVWIEALNWMDLQAMASGNLPRDNSRIAATLREDLARAQAFESTSDSLAAFREYQSAVRDFSGLAEVGVAKEKVAELAKSQAVRAAEKREASETDEQKRIVETPSRQMQKLSTGQLDADGFSQLLADISRLKSKTQRSGPNALVLRRALSQLVVQAYDSGQTCMQKRDSNTALAYFHLAAEGSSNAGFAHYQRARAWAMSSHRKEMMAELRQALSGGFHERSALDADEFQPYRGDTDFQALAADWKKSAG
jgi:predicted esterase